MRKPTLALLPVVAAAALVAGVLTTQVLAAAPAGAKHAINAVLIFYVEAHAGDTFQVGDNFTTVGRVVSVDGRPFAGRLTFSCQITDVAAGAGACLYYFFSARRGGNWHRRRA